MFFKLVVLKKQTKFIWKTFEVVNVLVNGVISLKMSFFAGFFQEFDLDFKQFSIFIYNLLKKYFPELSTVVSK